ncbi:hypothetical protein FRC08_018777 [Ceratobasidium sp. 394]|nr:hypothetical protein FRC08_018777 [Ceratobasidium sp. 394]
MTTNRVSFPRIVDWVLPLLIVAFSFWGLYMAVFEVGVGWLGCHAQQTHYAAVHILLSTAVALSIIALIFFLWALLEDHDVPPAVEPTVAEEWFKRYAHECFSEDGAVRIYDLGIWGNAKRFWATPIFGSERNPPILIEPPPIDPRIIERISGAGREN